MPKSIRVFALPTLVAATLSACGGGGGGGSVINQPSAAPAGGAEVAFSSFAATRPSQTVVMSGISKTARGDSELGLALDPMNASSTAKLSFDASGRLSGVTMMAPNSSVFLSVPADGCVAGACAAWDAQGNVGAVMDAKQVGWNYQTFGYWMTNTIPLQVGALSAGAVTAGNNVPTIGSATFRGHAGGLYFDANGTRFTTDAEMTAIADFSARSIQFSTVGTELQNTATGAKSTNSGLDLRGTLGYAAGSSLIAGPVNTADTTLSGTANGRFYGPNAQEIGGVYGLNAVGGSARMVGGFGGKR